MEEIKFVPIHKPSSLTLKKKTFLKCGGLCTTQTPCFLRKKYGRLKVLLGVWYLLFQELFGSKQLSTTKK